MGAGEGNRTPTVSLGICRIVAVMAADLAVRLPASTRGRPRFTLANGPLMAAISTARTRVSGPADHPAWRRHTSGERARADGARRSADRTNDLEPPALVCSALPRPMASAVISLTAHRPTSISIPAIPDPEALGSFASSGFQDR